MKRIINFDESFNFKDNLYILFLSAIIGGIFGFIYELFCYRIDLGYFVKRGSSYGPWIPIYVIGSILILFFTYGLKKRPLIVFILNVLITGLLEYISGFILLNYFNKRLWDYNTEIWNYGNINGFVCLRSVLFFGLSSLFLIYILIPVLINIYIKYTKFFIFVTKILSIIFILDIIIYNILN